MIPIATRVPQECVIFSNPIHAPRFPYSSLVTLSPCHLVNRAWSVLLGLLTITLCLLASACAPASQANSKEYMFWPPAPEDPHIQYLGSIASSSDVTGGQNKLDSILYGKQATPDLPFVRPYGIRLFQGCIYVCDATSANVSILDLRKKEVRVLGATGDQPLLKPIDIAVAPDGTKYVADTGLAAVVVYSPDDRYAGKFTVPNLRPVSLALRGNELYVADLKASCVRVFDRITYQQIRTIGTPGGEPGQIGGAMGVAVDHDGNVFINDVIGCRVQKFSPDGKFLASIGSLGDNPGNFVRPKLMTVDSAGILYVVDNAFANVQMFNDKQQLLMFFGGPGTHPGNMDMPAGICTSDADLDLFQPYVNPAFELQRLILVTNNFGRDKINIYALGLLKPGKTLADISPGRVNRVVGFNEHPTDSSAVITTMPTDTPTTAPSTLPATRPARSGPIFQFPPATRPAPPSEEPGAKPF